MASRELGAPVHKGFPKDEQNGEYCILATGCKSPWTIRSGQWPENGLGDVCLGPGAFSVFSGFPLAMLIFKGILKPTQDICGLDYLLQFCIHKCQILPLSQQGEKKLKTMWASEDESLDTSLGEIHLLLPSTSPPPFSPLASLPQPHATGRQKSWWL